MSNYSYTKKGVWSLNEVSNLVNLNSWDYVGGSTLYAYGINTRGECGISNVIPQPSPVQVPGNWANLFSVAQGTVLCHKTDGTLWGWGNNSHYMLGNESGSPQSSPVQVGAGGGGIYSNIDMAFYRRFSVGEHHCLAIKNDGSLWAWGNGGNGSLGMSGDEKAANYWSTSSLSIPEEVSGSGRWSICSTGRHSSLAIRGEGSLFTWGYNAFGQIGNNTTANYSSPIQIVGKWKTAHMFRDSALGFKENDPYVYLWGDNTVGQLGTNNTIHRSSPTLLSSDWLKITGSDRVVVGIKTDKTLWAWGLGTFGVLGQDLIPRNTNFVSSLGVNWSSIFSPVIGNHNIGIKTTGSLFTFGNNSHGQLGISTNITVSSNNSPIQIPGTWSYAAAGTNTSYAIRSDLTLWGWGINNFGQLGNSSTINYSSPNQIPGADWAYVQASSESVYAIKNPGSIWSWGRNNQGQLGHGDTINRSSPVQIGSLTNWSYIASGADHALCLSGTSDLYAVGDNSIGQLGNNSKVNANQLIQVIGTGYSNIASGNKFSLAVRTNGTLWSWGSNSSGQLGHQDTINRSSPTQIGSLTSWSSVIAGDGYAFAVKTNGTLWSWGKNQNGQLGVGDFISRSSPIQIGSLTNWSSTNLKYSLAQPRSFAISNDSTIYISGASLDSGTVSSNTPCSSPVQIPGADWKDFSLSETSIIATKEDGTQWNWGRITFLPSGSTDTEYYSSPVQITGTLWKSVAIGIDCIVGTK